jgi:hypothetical protein
VYGVVHAGGPVGDVWNSEHARCTGEGEMFCAF